MANLDSGLNQRPWRGIALRLAGAALLWLAWLAGSTLQHRRKLHQEVGPLEGALALVAVVAAIAGSATVAMGDHLFDRGEIAERWRQRRQDR